MSKSFCLVHWLPLLTPPLPSLVLSAISQKHKLASYMTFQSSKWLRKATALGNFRCSACSAKLGSGSVLRACACFVGKCVCVCVCVCFPLLRIRTSEEGWIHLPQLCRGPQTAWALPSSHSPSLLPLCRLLAGRVALCQFPPA
jgi:hypothetical protein